MKLTIVAATGGISRHALTRLKTGAAAGLLALTAVACGADASATSDPAPPAGDGTVVVVTGMAYEPDRVTIEAGETVTWVFDDGAVRHDVAGDGFQSDILASGGTFSHAFEEPGTYDYVCTLHPNMTGTVEVTG